MTTITIPGNVYNALRTCAGDDDVRYYLNGILIDFANGLLVATDGHRLLKYPIDVEHAWTSISKKQPDTIVAVTSRKVDAGGQIRIDVSDAGGSFENRATATATAFSKTGKQKWSEVVEIIDAEFPDYDRVIPPWTKMADGGTVPAIAYNPVLMGEVVSALIPGGCACRVHPTTDGKGACRVVIASCPDAELILMPMRWPD